MQKKHLKGVQKPLTPLKQLKNTYNWVGTPGMGQTHPSQDALHCSCGSIPAEWQMAQGQGTPPGEGGSGIQFGAAHICKAGKAGELLVFGSGWGSFARAGAKAPKAR